LDDCIARKTRAILDGQPAKLRRTTAIVSRWRCSTNARAFANFACAASGFFAIARETLI
jgi:hypothetical protein